MFLLEEDKEDPFDVIRGYYAGRLSKGDLLLNKKECIRYIEDSGCIEYCRIIQRLFMNQAAEVVNTIPAHEPWKEDWMKVCGLVFVDIA